MKKSEKKVKVIAIILCAALVMGAAFGITAVCLSAKYEKELAACRALSDGGLSPEVAADVIGTALALSEERTASNLFSAAEALDKCDGRALANAVYAYQRPDEMPKGSVFIGLKYFKQLKRIAKEHRNDGSLLEEKIPKLSKEQWAAFFAALCAIAKEIRKSGRESFNAFVTNAENIFEYRLKLADLPLKTIYNAYRYAIDVTRDVDLTTLDFLNVIIKNDFFENVVMGFEPIISSMRKMTFKEISDIVTFLPNTAAFTVACTKGLISYGAEGVSRGTIYLSEEIFCKQFYINEDKLTENINFLISLNPDELDSDNCAEANRIGQEIWNAFKF